MGVHIGLELFKGAIEQGYVCFRGIVLVLHAGAAHHSAFRQLFQNGFGHFYLFAEGTLQILQRDVAGAEQGGLVAHHRHYRALHAHITLAAVQNEGQATVHIGKDILRIGGAGLAGEVGTGGCKGAAALLDDRTGHRVAGHADTHRVQTGAALGCHLRAAGHDDGEGAGAEGRHQQLGTLRYLADQTRQHLRAGDMDDQGIVLRAALGHEDLLHCLAVAGVGGNAVHRLSGQGHQLPAAQQLGGLYNAFCLVGRQNFGFDFHTSYRSFYV